MRYTLSARPGSPFTAPLATAAVLATSLTAVLTAARAQPPGAKAALARSAEGGARGGRQPDAPPMVASAGASPSQAWRDPAEGFVPSGAGVSVFDTSTPAMTRLDPQLRAALRRAATSALATGVEVRVNSGWRSARYQQHLFDDAVAEHGSVAVARRWVATPDTSAHVSGDAVDVGPPNAAAWLSRHGDNFGLCRTYANEPWHFELRLDAPAKRCPVPFADATQNPRLQRR